MQKILVIRFSSFGDIVQTMVVLQALKERFPDSEIHWLTRADFAPLLENHPLIDKLIAFDRNRGFFDLLKLASLIRQSGYTHIYDAHNNTRSNFLKLILFFHLYFTKVKYIQRPKYRWKRVLLFWFRINLFPWPFVLVKSYLAPLKAWGIDKKLNAKKHMYLSSKDHEFAKNLCPDSYICMAPSAAWDLKRWPTECWQELIDKLSDVNIVLLGGPQDEFISELVEQAAVRSGKLLNLAGKTSLSQSCAIIENAKAIIGGDSGLTHVGDQFQIPTFCIIGAAAFAYPAYPTTRVFDSKLSCQPCSKDGRGRCNNKIFKACLYQQTPQIIYEQVVNIL